MAVKTVYEDGLGHAIELTLLDGEPRVLISDETGVPILVIPPSELTTFRDFINDELDRIEKELGDAEQAEAEEEHEEFMERYKDNLPPRYAGSTKQQNTQESK